MKILRLTLAGFGPFKDEQVVDFEAFDDAGLFLGPQFMIAVIAHQDDEPGRSLQVTPAGALPSDHDASVRRGSGIAR